MAIGQEEQAVQPITMNETVPMDDGVGCVGSNSTTMAAAVTDEGQGKIVTNDGQGTISAAVTNDKPLGAVRSTRGVSARMFRNDDPVDD